MCTTEMTYNGGQGPKVGVHFLAALEVRVVRNQKHIARKTGEQRETFI
jgi:hypothetical protein